MGVMVRFSTIYFMFQKSWLWWAWRASPCTSDDCRRLCRNGFKTQVNKTSLLILYRRQVVEGVTECSPDPKGNCLRGTTCLRYRVMLQIYFLMNRLIVNMFIDTGEFSKRVRVISDQLFVTLYTLYLCAQTADPISSEPFFENSSVWRSTTSLVIYS